MPFELVLDNPDAKIEYVGQSHAAIHKGEVAEGTFFINIPLDKIAGRKTPIKISVQSENKTIDEVKTNFMGPGK